MTTFCIHGIIEVMQKDMKYFYLCAISVGIFVYVLSAQATMSSTNFQIRWDTLSTGGLDSSSSASYLLRDVVGEVSVDSSESSNYEISDGYRSGIDDRVISFSLFSQLSSSLQSISAFSGTTVTTNTTSLSVGDHVAIIQDLGENQISAIGKIASIGIGQIVLDEIKTAGTTPVIDGSNDVLYRLSGSSGSLGTLSSTSVETAIIGFSVTADLMNGYVVKVFDDGNFRFGSYDIDDVLDGQVTAGSEEYGGRSSDVTLANSTFDTQDTAFTTSLQDVVTSSSFAYEERNFVTVKAAMSTSTVAGSYAHQLGFVISGNF
ncbi:MAG: hypothetical protein UU08_C0033G0005 [Candidatus Uhrbacteria bacterium GW2011_GWE2_40_58]|nr:MAG: hypothetical protein UU08_C0033G0005 [Candidatus Uhrbacteria bacterium GW2011_GWE2_40_58]